MAAHEREPIMSKAKGSEEDQEQFWRMAIETWQSSGLSIRQFCKQEGLSEPQFYVWRKKLADCCIEPTDQDSSGQETFIEVALPKNSDSAIEVLLTSGNMVRIPCGADSATLSNVMSALHAAGLC
jgi:transposase